MTLTPEQEQQIADELFKRVVPLFIDSLRRAGSEQGRASTPAVGASLYAAVNALLAHIGAEGQISAHHTLVHDAMSALKALDGGVFRPELAAPAEPADDDLLTVAYMAGRYDSKRGVLPPKTPDQKARDLAWVREQMDAPAEPATHSAPVVQGEAVACIHEAYQGRCIHCDLPTKNGAVVADTPPAARTAEPAEDLQAEMECDALSAWNGSIYTSGERDAVHPMFLDAFIKGCEAARRWYTTPQAPTQGEDAARLASDGPVKALRSALGAMLTQFGMDEDEWSKPTFNQARAALAVQSAPEGDYEMMELVRHAFNKLPRYSFHLVEGGVRRVPDRYGAWVEWQAGHELFDAEVWDGLRRAAQAQGDKT